MLIRFHHVGHFNTDLHRRATPVAVQVWPFQRVRGQSHLDSFLRYNYTLRVLIDVYKVIWTKIMFFFVEMYIEF